MTESTTSVPAPSVQSADTPSTPRPTAPVDLRSLFRAIGGHTPPQRALTTSPAERPHPEIPAELLDDRRARVTAAALRPIGFVDGIQAALTVAWRDHRPVYLTFVAAGCIGPGARRNAELVAVRERLDLVGSHLDSDWLINLPECPPAVLLDASTPDEIERAALARLGADREALEHELVDCLVADGAGIVVLDGSLVKRPVDPRLVGVVKTTRTRWLQDESELWGMPEGWRSPRFKIPAGTHGVGVDRYSCYLRLFDAKHRGWDHGLIRLESYDPDLLDPLAALAMSDRQSKRSRDSRGDRHLASVRVCEDILRARRPVVFGL